MGKIQDDVWSIISYDTKVCVNDTCLCIGNNGNVTVSYLINTYNT